MGKKSKRHLPSANETLITKGNNIKGIREKKSGYWKNTQI